jgi:hypothetical protein
VRAYFICVPDGTYVLDGTYVADGTYVIDIINIIILTAFNHQVKLSTKKRLTILTLAGLGEAL